MSWLCSKGYGYCVHRLSRQVSTLSHERNTIKEKPNTGASKTVKPPSDGELKPTSLQIGTGLAMVAVVAKLVMMYDESLEPERVAQKAREFAKAQESLEPYTREEWDELQSVRPRTPFETSLGRERGRIRNGDPVSFHDFRDWVIDVVIESLQERDDAARGFRHSSNKF